MDFVIKGKGYFKGIQRFLDQYWHMIHLAAGWGALRAFLLVSKSQHQLCGAVQELTRYIMLRC